MVVDTTYRFELLEFLKTHNPATVSAFVWFIAILQFIIIALCLSRALVDDPPGWAYTVFVLV